MSRRPRRGLRVLKAVSSSLRLKVLNLLLERGPLSYTEIMRILRLNPSRDAGRFAYHLKYLLKEKLIEPDVEKKRYRLTDLGRTVIGMAEEIEEEFFKRRKMVVRTSRLAMEDFDKNKIVESLIREGGVPVDLAQKTAREAETRLLEFKTKYLTAPLIREFVNAILVEKGLEEYRHKLTRLGLPVYDVAQLIKSMGATALGADAAHKAAGDAVIEEYTLLNVLPRDIADAHLSGTLHINNLGCWVLKPREFMHDLRFFFQHGLSWGTTRFGGASYGPPKSIEAALLTASNILELAAAEVSGEQTFDYFNIFMAPFVRGISEERVRDALRMFVFNLRCSRMNQGFPVEASLGLELVVPEFLREQNALGPGAESIGHYADFVEEARLVASLLLDTVSEKGRFGPVLNPSVIIKVRPEVPTGTECDFVLFKAHKLAAELGLPYFANLCIEGQDQVSYSATGCRFASSWMRDWELDTLRIGSIDSIMMNLPRASYQAERNQTRLYEILDEQLEMALRALEIKYQTIKQRSREGLLPFLMQEANGDHYLRLRNASRLVSLVGLNETVQSLLGKAIDEDVKALDFAEKIVAYLNGSIQKRSKKPEARPLLSLVSNPEAAKRLAQLDVENYGWAKVRAQGSREEPFYTDLVAVPLTREISWEDRLEIEGRFHKVTPGSHLAIIQLSDLEVDVDALVSATRRIAETCCVGFYTYNRHLTQCTSCQKTFYGILQKCPVCGSVGTLSSSSRVSAKHTSMALLDSARRATVTERPSYLLA